MKIDIKRILPNPHRDLNLNPLRNDQVAKLVESIQRTGFWDNLVVRKHPKKAGFYELAYGHNRMAAVTKAGITEVDLPVRDLSDWDMFVCMVDENNTQATITPQIVYENIGVGAKLLEQYITESETCEEFQAKVSSRLKNSARSAPNAQTKPQDYARVRNAVLAGEGIGKDLVQRYIPDAAKTDAVVSTVLASIYGERRAAAARIKAEAAQKEKARLDAELAERREQERAAEAKRKADEAAAKEAQRKANEAVREQQAKAAIAKAQREAEAAEKRAEQSRRDRVAAEAEATKAKQRADLAQRDLLATQDKAKEIAKQTSIPKDVLLSLGSPTLMAEFAMLVKRIGIATNKVEAAAQKVVNAGWSQKTMREQLPVWWDEVSGEQGRRYARAANERKREADIKKYCNGDLNGFIMKQNDKLRAAIRDMDTVQEYVEFASPTLQKNSAVLYAAVAKQLFTIIAKIDGQSVEKTVSTLTKMLSHR